MPSTVEYKLNPAQKEFLELPNHNYGLDVSLYQGGWMAMGRVKPFLVAY